MIKILTVFPGNGAKFDNTVVDAIKLILLNYQYCLYSSQENRKGKVTLSPLPAST